MGKNVYNDQREICSKKLNSLSIFQIKILNPDCAGSRSIFGETNPYNLT